MAEAWCLTNFEKWEFTHMVEVNKQGRGGEGSRGSMKGEE